MLIKKSIGRYSTEYYFREKVLNFQYLLAKKVLDLKLTHTLFS